MGKSHVIIVVLEFCLHTEYYDKQSTCVALEKERMIWDFCASYVQIRPVSDVKAKKRGQDVPGRGQKQAGTKRLDNFTQHGRKEATVASPSRRYRARKRFRASHTVMHASHTRLCLAGRIKLMLRTRPRPTFRG